MIEEADLSAERVLPSNVDRLAIRLRAHSGARAAVLDLYAVPARMRHALDLGARLRRAADHRFPSRIPISSKDNMRKRRRCCFVFYVLIGTRRLWARPATVPFLIVASLLVLPEAVGASATLANLVRFVTHDIVPTPLRGADLLAAATWMNSPPGCGPIAYPAGRPGVMQTLGAVADGAGRHGRHRAHAVPVHMRAVRRPDRQAARARGAGDRAVDAGIHGGLCAAAAARPLDVAGDHRACRSTMARSSAI